MLEKKKVKRWKKDRKRDEKRVLKVRCFWKRIASLLRILRCGLFYIGFSLSLSPPRLPLRLLEVRASERTAAGRSASPLNAFDAPMHGRSMEKLYEKYMNMFKSSDEFGKSLFFEIQLFLCFFEIIWNSIKKIVEVHHHPEDLQKWFAEHAGPLKQALQKCYG